MIMKTASRHRDDAIDANFKFGKISRKTLSRHRPRLGRRDGRAPVLVDGRELLALGRELFVDVRRLKNGLQVHPVALDLEPLVQHLPNDKQLVVPGLDALLEWPLEGGELHGLRGDGS